MANAATEQSVLSIRTWTPRLLSFRTTRHAGFRFKPGLYGRVGLGSDAGEVVWRPLSIVSAAQDEYLEFLVVLVPGGPFSALVSRLKAGDRTLVEQACYGFLTVDQLAPGHDLWLLASGSGLGPFLSILRDPAVWRDFDHLILVHSVREGAELAYRDEIAELAGSGLVQGLNARLDYVPVVTRQAWPSALPARIPALIEDGRLERQVGLTLDPARARVMVCGNPEMASACRALLSARGFKTSRRGAPGQMAFEKYW